MHYECCYMSGGQFVFEERPRWVVIGLMAVVIVGLVLGLCVGLLVSFAGLQLFESLYATAACYAGYYAYDVTFKRVSSSVDGYGFVVACAVAASILTSLIMVIRLSLLLELNAGYRCVLFAIGGVILGLMAYSYAALCCSEDERKHFLGLSSSPGKTLQEPPAVDVPADGTTSDAVWRFVQWILSWQWWLDLNDWPTAGDEESRTNNSITVQNKTLKLVKVCFYSPDDIFCWVPFGGISGKCVGLVKAEESRSFDLPRRARQGKGAYFQLKVFQPGVIDKELARYPKALRGQTFTFVDVEGMVKRSRLLSSAGSNLRQGEGTDSGNSAIAESSEDEGLWSPAVTRNSRGKLTALTLQAFEPASRPAAPVQRYSLVKRNGSAGNLQQLSGCSLESQSSGGRMEARKAAPDEVVVRNRSNQEIRILLFRSNDYCCMIPLVGKFLTCGDTVLPDCERRFNPQHTDAQEFTLKVYSVGSGARELTYLTVSRGCTYTFCDSLLS